MATHYFQSWRALFCNPSCSWVFSQNDHFCVQCSVTQMIHRIQIIASFLLSAAPLHVVRRKCRGWAAASHAKRRFYNNGKMYTGWSNKFEVYDFEQHYKVKKNSWNFVRWSAMEILHHTGLSSSNASINSKTSKSKQHLVGYPVKSRFNSTKLVWTCKYHGNANIWAESFFIIPLSSYLRLTGIS